MRGIGRGHGDKVQTVLAVAFAFQHLLPVAIGTVRGDPETACKVAAAVGIGVQRAGHEVEIAVRQGSKPVRRADLAALAPADHAPSQSCHVASSLSGSYAKPMLRR